MWKDQTLQYICICTSTDDPEGAAAINLCRREGEGIGSGVGKGKCNFVRGWLVTRATWQQAWFPTRKGKQRGNEESTTLPWHHHLLHHIPLFPGAELLSPSLSLPSLLRRTSPSVRPSVLVPELASHCIAWIGNTGVGVRRRFLLLLRPILGTIWHPGLCPPLSIFTLLLCLFIHLWMLDRIILNECWRGTTVLVGCSGIHLHSCFLVLNE